MGPGPNVVDVARLGNYQLLHRLAVGGMGEVFLARQRGLAGFQRLVALKRLLPDFAERPDSVELFIDEARIGATLAHPNIVQVHEFGNEHGVYFLTMELVIGQNLDRIFRRGIERGIPLRRPLAVHIVIELLRGLSHAHEARDPHGEALGIVHRDVSPQNVLVSYAGDVKLMDFGIAKATNASHRTRTGIVRGKPAYMAPEQIAGEPVDPRTDVYSAAVLLWELTLGRRLFTAETELELVQQVADGVIPTPRSIDPQYSLGLEEVVMAALRPKPADRTRSAAALVDALRAHVDGLDHRDATKELGELVRTLFRDEAAAIDVIIREVAPPVASPTIASTEPTQLLEPPPVKPARAKRTALALAIAALFALALVIVVFAWPSEPARSVEVATAPSQVDAAIDTAPPDADAVATAPDAGSGSIPVVVVERPRVPARREPAPVSAVAARLHPESAKRLPIKLVEGCSAAGKLPPSITFELRVDKTGRVKEASIANRGALSEAVAICIHRWIMRWTFLGAERESKGLLTVKLR